MRQHHGIIHTTDGTYLHAVARRDKKGLWGLQKVSSFDCGNILRQLLLSGNGIYLGVPSRWKPSQSTGACQNDVGEIPRVDSPDDVSNKATFEAVAHATEISIHHDNLKNNLMGIFSEEAFLVSIPLSFLKNTGDDFIAIYHGDNFFTIGIIQKKRLVVSFTLAPGTREALECHWGRIARYWALKNPDHPVIERFVAFGKRESFPETLSGKSLEFVPQAESLDDASLKALGVAMIAETQDAVPRFTDITPEAEFRKIRTLTYLACAGMLVVSLLFSIGAGAMYLWYTVQKNRYEKQYQSLIVDNLEIKRHLNDANKLAQSILTLEETFKRKTLWSEFLYGIAKARPEDVFYERIGSEPLKGSGDAIRIALSGWTTQESSVTAFIGSLKQLDYLSECSLVSLERETAKQTIYGFKILCTLQLKKYLKKK
jgi:hypothetical protein